MGDSMQDECRYRICVFVEGRHYACRIIVPAMKNVKKRGMRIALGAEAGHSSEEPGSSLCRIMTCPRLISEHYRD
jgi:hypothetical protein